MVDVYNATANKSSWNLPPRAKLSTIVEYGIDRLFRIYRLYDIGLWEVNVVGGYYGQEVDGITLIDSKIKDAFLKDVDYVLHMADDELAIIRFLLEKEYKYIHESIADVTRCEIAELEAEALNRQMEHFSRVKWNETDNYDMIDGLPIGIVYKGTRLIDGYHRLGKAGPGKHKFIVIS